MMLFLEWKQFSCTKLNKENIVLEYNFLKRITKGFFFSFCSATKRKYNLFKKIRQLKIYLIFKIAAGRGLLFHL